jgi:hypothetical protein
MGTVVLIQIMQYIKVSNSLSVLTRNRILAHWEILPLFFKDDNL